MARKIEVVEVRLYSIYGSALVNGDTSGLSGEELEELAYIESELAREHGTCNCVDMLDDSDFGYPDIAVERLRGDVSTFVFHK